MRRRQRTARSRGSAGRRPGAASPAPSVPLLALLLWLACSFGGPQARSGDGSGTSVADALSPRSVATGRRALAFDGHRRCRTPTVLLRQSGSDGDAGRLVSSDDPEELHRPPLAAAAASEPTAGGSSNGRIAQDGTVPPSSSSSDAHACKPVGGSSSSNSESSNSNTLPSYRKLVVFVTTTILIWLSEPLLSLVDMTVVSLTSPTAARSVSQIAALGPATTLYDSAIYMTYFLAIATTNQLAPLLAQQKWKKLRQSTSHIMGLAVLCGTVVSVAVCAFGRSILAPMVGNLSDPHILQLAYRYCFIRGLVAPIGVCAMIAQSFCLANLDTTTPAIAVLVSSVVNVVGDLILSPTYGIVGAAVATAAAAVASAVVLLRQVARKTNEWKGYQDLNEGRVTAAASEVSQVVNGTIRFVEPVASISNETNVQKQRSTQQRAAVDNRKNDPSRMPFASIPDRKAAVELVQLAGPVFFAMIAKIACFSILTVQATKFGVIPLAAHNILMRVFSFFSCFGDSLGQAAQSFFPSVDAKQQRTLLQRLFYVASFMGVTNAVLASGIMKHATKFLTPDLSIQSLLANHVSFLSLSVLLHPIILLLEGVVLSKRDLAFLLIVYSMISVVHTGIVFSTGTIQMVWRALFTFQIMRFLQLGWRVFVWKGRKRQHATA